MLHTDGEYVSSSIPLSVSNSHILTHDSTDVVFGAVIYSYSFDRVQAYLAGRSYHDLSYLSMSDDLVQSTEWQTQVSSQSLDIQPGGKIDNSTVFLFKIII